MVNEAMSMCLSSNDSITVNEVFSNVSFTSTGGGASGQDCTFLTVCALLLNSVLETLTYR